MRIVAGEWRGRMIKAPKDEGVRPTGDRVREAWMSIVGNAVVGARVLDLFAGSGALGLEALSRGAASADFVDIAPTSLAAVAHNASTLGAGDRAKLHRSDALRFVEALDPTSYDVAFADPPYGMSLATRLAERWLRQPFVPILGIEHHRDEHLPGGDDRRKYGDTVITFFRIPASETDSASFSAGSDDTDASG